MDQFLLLAVTLAQGDDLELVYCLSCRGALLIDPLSMAPRICLSCRKSESRARKSSPEAHDSGSERNRVPEGDPQQDLF
jgi:hypothetical protein